MKVLLASYSDVGGGAARAALRVLDGLRLTLPETRVVVAEHLGSHPAARATRPWSGNRLVMAALRKINRVPLAWHGAHGGMWSADNLSGGIARLLIREQPDVVNLHWIQHGGLLTSELASLGCPIVWTLHDLAPLTGGCHYPGGCGGWQSACGDCPMLRRHGPCDRSRRGFASKQATYAGLDLTFIAPSRWMAEQARRSPLASGRVVEHIPNGLDQRVFHPTPPAEARQLMGLPGDGPLVLFGADRAMRDRRKGFHLLREALPRLRDIPGLRLAVFGASRIDDADSIPFPIHALGTITDDTRLATLYSAADLLVVPSLEDNLPNTIAEALSCGCPCVGFKVGGIPEMIDEGRTGALAAAGDPLALAEAMRRVLLNSAREHSRVQARAEACASYDLATCGRRYHDMLARAVENHGRQRP